MTISYNAFF